MEADDEEDPDAFDDEDPHTPVPEATEAEATEAEGGEAEGGEAEGGKAESGEAEGGEADGGEAEGGPARDEIPAPPVIEIMDDDVVKAEPLQDAAVDELGAAPVEPPPLEPFSLDAVVRATPPPSIPETPYPTTILETPPPKKQVWTVSPGSSGFLS